MADAEDSDDLRSRRAGRYGMPVNGAQRDSPTAGPTDGRPDTVTRATEVLSTVSAFWVLLLAAIYLYDILGRELFNAPFLGTHEIVSNSIVGILFLELPSTIKRGAMLRTTIVFGAVSAARRRIIECLSYLLGVALFLAIIFGGWDAMIVSWQLLEIEGAGAFEVPIYPVRTLIIVFSAICALVYVQLLYLTLAGEPCPARRSGPEVERRRSTTRLEG